MKIGFIGGGNMAEALIAGFLKSNKISSSQITVYDIKSARLEYLNDKYNILCKNNLTELINIANIIILAVKPQNFPQITEELKKYLGNDKLIVSIMAKVRLKDIEAQLGNSIKLIRVMPNILASENLAISGILKTNKLSSSEYTQIKNLFSLVGDIVETEEEIQLDILTVLSGCLPAFVCVLIEVLTDAGITAGIEHKMAYNIITSVVYATLKSLVDKREYNFCHELKYKITSPGGITASMLNKIEEEGLRKAILRGIKVALNRLK